MKRPPRIVLFAAQEFHKNYKIYLTWLIWFTAFVLLVRATLGGPDGSRYMAYIRSIVFDRDLLLMNELEHYGQRVIVTSTGYSAQIANVGVIPFWLPFYLMGLLSAGLSGDAGSGLASNYALWLDFGDWVYGLLALIVMYRWARTRFTRRLALVATLLVGFGSSFIYYVTALAPSYHTVAALLCALFFYLWDTTRAQRRTIQWFGLGLLVGLLMSLAQYHAVLLIFLALDFKFQISNFRLKFANRKSQIANLLSAFCFLLTGLLFPLIPQLIAWGIIFGNPFANPYTLDANWSGAHVLDVLFSPYHGLYFTAPILILATLGWLIAFKRDMALYGGALIVLLGIAYSSSTRIGWWAGVSFGARYFIGMTPLFVMGFAALMARPPSAVRRLPSAVLPLAVIGVLCVLWTYGYFLQAFTNLTSFSEYHPAQQWIGDQIVVAQHLGEMLAAHWALPRAPALIANLAGFGFYSLIITRVVGGWLLAGRMDHSTRWIAALALVPIGFGALLLTTIAPGELHKQQLAASGYYEQNLARSQFDFEQFSNEYVERAHYDEAIGQTDAARADVQRAIALWPVKSRQLVAESEVARYQPLNLKFGDNIELIGYRIDVVRDTLQEVGAINCPANSPPCPFKVRLLWRTHLRLPYDYDVGVLLLDTNGQVVTRTLPTRGLDPFPATWWPSGMLMSDEQVLDASAIPTPSLVKIKVEMFDASANKRLPTSDDNGNRHDGVIGEVKRRSGGWSEGRTYGTLGGKVSLLSYIFSRETNGASLLLLWRAESVIDKDYTVFVHLLDAQNHIVAQSDAQPVGGRYPTHAWDKGEVVSDMHRISIAADALAKVDHIAVGLYTPSDGARLPSSTGGDMIVIRGVRP